MKPRIFIGSSGEGIDIANYVKSLLQIDFEVYLWTDDIFKANKSFLDTLLKEAGYFDFGILIATKDDYTKSRDKSFDVPRDNVIFEFGLFLGRLGPSRAFIIQEEDAKLPSDLFGITIPRFKKMLDISNSDSLNKEIEKIKQTIQEKFTLGELGLLPSTALAIGYYYNFISTVCETLQAKKEIEVGGKRFLQFEINVVLPKALDSDIKKRATIYFRRNELTQIQFDSSGRSFPVFVTYDNEANGVLKLYDMPTTLNGIDKAIEMYMQK
ncbi:MAG: TIR domain-containing protein [Candidatus Magasanikiibacteriota bacterium]